MTVWYPSLITVMGISPCQRLCCSVIAADANKIGNNGLHMRYLYTKESAVTELVGPIGLDIFEQVRYTPNGVKIKLRFEKQRHPFVLMSALDNFKIELMSVNLYIRKITPSPGVLLGHAQALMIYLFGVSYYVAFNTVQVISRGVVGRAEETST